MQVFITKNEKAFERKTQEAFSENKIQVPTVTRALKKMF